VTEIPTPRFFATAAAGTEGALRDELRELGLPAVKATRGGVHFGREDSDAMRACMYSRIAVRVLELLTELEAPDASALYEEMAALPWESLLGSRQTLAVRASSRDNSALRHSGFVAQKSKDAIVDRVRARRGQRPAVDREDPDLLVSVHLSGKRARVLLDWSGRPLHLRGYRARALRAPIKETLAAAVVRLSKWDRQSTFIDPMCGSGTLAIEAACWAAGRPPGLGRPFGFERWKTERSSERDRLWRQLRVEAREALSDAKRSRVEVLASDRDTAAVAAARDNARRAGVKLRLRQAELSTLEPAGESGHLLTNAPYGVRLDAAPALFRELGAAFRRMRGHRVAALVRGRELRKVMRARPALEHTLWNGSVECRLFAWDV
jgi:23S rRNA G2445 N2-methylase RlmL